MPAQTASTPGKIILFGEHAVVYGRPALAVPVTQVGVRAIVTADPRGTPGNGHLLAPEIHLDTDTRDLPDSHPLRVALEQVRAALGLARFPAYTLKITSTIPVAAGLGSGAAVAVAVIRAMSAFVGRPLPDEKVSALAYEVEKIHHGTPSGLDNTVITYARPVYFVRGQPLETFEPAAPLTLVIGDTGQPSPTAATVGDVRKHWQADRARYEALFDEIGALTRQARTALERGPLSALGPLMNLNHHWLCAIGVSSPELDRLVHAARQAGAPGAKLSGAGRGGNMIALASPASAPAIAAALRNAGAVRTLTTQVG